jgi:hypothetical protein
LKSRSSTTSGAPIDTSMSQPAAAAATVRIASSVAASRVSWKKRSPLV